MIIAFEDGDDVIETRLERTVTAALEYGAEEVLNLLEAKGWTAIRTA